MTRAPAVALLGIVALAGMVTAAPAAGADTPTGGWTDPGPVGDIGGVPVVYVEDERPLRGWAEFPSGVASVQFGLAGDAAPAGDPCSAAESVPAQTAAGGARQVQFAFEASFPCNRRYLVRATVVPRSRPLADDAPQALDLWVAVAVPPAPVSDLRATFASSPRAVTVAWDTTSREPDLQGYEIRRSTDGGPFEAIADAAPSATSFTDAFLPPDGGELRYQVVSMRPAPDGDATVFAPTGSIAEVEVAAAPRGATVAASPGGSSDGGGSALGGQWAAGPTGTGVSSVRRVFQAPGSARTTATTIDTGYQQHLPFGSGSGSAVATFEDGDGAQRQTLLLVGGAVLAFTWAMLLRFLSRRPAYG
jgi:hypothetical protein